MTPFLFAVALTLSPLAPLQPYRPIDGNIQPSYLSPLPSRPFETFIKTPKVNLCNKLGTRTAAPDGVRMFKRLDQLPKSVMEHAVWRSVGGCPVREIVFEGRTYYVASIDPRIERLDPASQRIQQR
ncbi:MAG TPA: hypothetical protein VGM25_13825 [Caulobacteraceae bacterium]|jgi:hypothetical protein